MAHYETLGCLLGLLGRASDSIIMSFNVAGTNSPNDLSLKFLDVSLAFKQITIKVIQDLITFGRYKKTFMGFITCLYSLGRASRTMGLPQHIQLEYQTMNILNFCTATMKMGCLGSGGNQIAWSADWRRFGQAANERRLWPQTAPTPPLSLESPPSNHPNSPHTHTYAQYSWVKEEQSICIYTKCTNLFIGEAVERKQRGWVTGGKGDTCPGMGMGMGNSRGSQSRERRSKRQTTSCESCLRWRIACKSRQRYLLIVASAYVLECQSVCVCVCEGPL